MRESSIDLIVWHIDVDWIYPDGTKAIKGSTVRRLKDLSWVQTAVRQVGLYLLCQWDHWEELSIVRKDLDELASGKLLLLKHAVWLR